jgi:hypothetical protein
MNIPKIKNTESIQESYRKDAEIVQPAAAQMKDMEIVSPAAAQLKQNEIVQMSSGQFVQAAPAQISIFLEFSTLFSHFEIFNTCKAKN